MSCTMYDLSSLALTGGGVLADLRLAYSTYGRLNAAADNCVLLPSYYGGTDKSYRSMIGPGLALDPDCWFIVLTNMFGNGVSSSPSNHAGMATGIAVSIADNVRAQHLLLSHLGISELALVGGWSMGGMQALAWGMLYPRMVKRIASWCATARCWPLNHVFLGGLRTGLLADGSAGHLAGLRAFGRAYAAWAYSSSFYRDELWRLTGASDLEAFLLEWENDHASWDWRDLLAMLETWQASEPHRWLNVPSLRDALHRITARTLVMPCDTDAYFVQEECMLEAGMIPNSDVRILKSPYGHCAGAPGRFARETSQIDHELRSLLAWPASDVVKKAAAACKRIS